MPACPIPLQPIKGDYDCSRDFDSFRDCLPLTTVPYRAIAPSGLEFTGCKAGTWTNLRTFARTKWRRRFVKYNHHLKRIEMCEGLCTKCLIHLIGTMSNVGPLRRLRHHSGLCLGATERLVVGAPQPEAEDRSAGPLDRDAVLAQSRRHVLGSRRGGSLVGEQADFVGRWRIPHWCVAD